MAQEANQTGINSATSYAKQNGAKQSEIERTRRVSETLFEKHLPKESILAPIIKEIPQEGFNESEIEKEFGKETLETAKTIKQMEGIIEKNYGKMPSETISSIMLSLAKDFQPLIIKIAETADALYNKEKIINEEKYAQKAEEIWHPLAAKLGLAEYAWKIQDFAFRENNREAFEKVKKMINKTREEREKVVEETIAEIKGLLKGKIEAEVMGRPKSFKSIHEKLKKVPMKKMYDIYGVRIICNKEKECYEALGYVHSKYEIIPEAFDDYIQKPKSDGYKSIHTAVRRGNDVIEIQIRTWEHHMRAMAEPYWKYKRLKKDKEFEKELSWERQLIEWQKAAGKEWLGKKMSGKKIFAFTPKNQAIALPAGATAIDFAFAVHTDIGRRAEKAKINGKYAPMETKLNNLDRVEIITSEKVQMKKPWFNFAFTEKAKTKIKAAFKMQTVKKTAVTRSTNYKKIKIAECCHPLPGEDVIGVKTTKRRIVIHKKDCKNAAKISKDRLVEIEFEREKGKTEIRVTVIDRPGILGEMLGIIRASGAGLNNTSMKIKKSGYGEAIFRLEVEGVLKLEKIMDRLEKVPGVQSVERT